MSCHVVVPLVYLCKLSIDQGIFHKELKLANVLPLYKTDDPFLFNNYRPVSVLSILSKVFEKNNVLKADGIPRNLQNFNQ